MNEEMNTFLRGQKIRKMIVMVSEPIREKYDLKQIEVDILGYLGSNENCCLRDIHKTMMVNKGQASKAMESLCNRKFIKQIKNNEDRRYNNYSITDEGKPLVDEILKVYEETKAIVMEGVSTEDLEVVRKVARIICKNIDQMKI